MSKRFLILFFFFVLRFHPSEAEALSVFVFPENTVLSEQARVSVITCGPGAEIYSLFGHTALRVKDSQNRIDLVFNYGTFQFDTPHFYLKFAGGRLAYYLSVSSYSAFETAYILENRSLSEQVLNLRPEEVQQVFQVLESNLKPENRFYIYQFFSDNCTSRVYDLLKEVLREDFKTDTSYIKEELSYRQLIRPYLRQHPWVRLGMNIALGLETDERTQLEGRLFLPAELEIALNHTQNGGIPLVKEQNMLFKPVESLVKEAEISVEPFLFLSVLALLLVVITFYEFRTGIRLYWIDRIIFGVTGVIGVILLLLWLFSAHTPTHKNLNILWLNPLNLLMVLGYQKFLKLQITYAKGAFLLVLALLCVSLFNPFFISEFYPISLMLALRFLWFVKRGRKPTSLESTLSGG